MIDSRYEMVEAWLNTFPLSEQEERTINLSRNKNKIEGTVEQYTAMEAEFFKRMPFCNISTDTRKIRFADTATELIDKIFEKEVDDDTLVVVSDMEHPSVVNNYTRVKNCLLLDINKDIHCLNTYKVINEAKKYKKVFVYIIGTLISSGRITPQSFYSKLKKEFVNLNIEHTMVLDDVHGMFFVPRDYSIFDYVVYTAHACISMYDMGMLISKDGDIGTKIYNDGMDYLSMIDVILTRKEKIFNFYYVMQHFFEKWLAGPHFNLLSGNSTHLFSMQTHNCSFVQEIHDRIDQYDIRLEGNGTGTNFILIRNARFIKTPHWLIPGLQAVEKYLPYLYLG